MIGTSKLNGVVPRPFLKWAGGKRQLLPRLMAAVRDAGTFERYHEPFVGGGALFFELSGSHLLRRHAWLSDSNPKLIEAYSAIKQDVEDVISALRRHEKNHSEDHYYATRARAPRTLVSRAARLIYLNKTCYNGLYRENRKGEFNTPIGSYKEPNICDEATLRLAAAALKHAQIEARSFETVLDKAKAGDLVYFDPPYHPVSKTSSFTAYSKDRFDEDSQRQLADVFRQLDKNEVKVLLSNSMTPLIEELYAGFTIDKVHATRAVNSRADRRGKIAEALIRNF